MHERTAGGERRGGAYGRLQSPLARPPSSMIGSSVVRSLRTRESLDDEARKLLTFVDNRRDASLQVGYERVQSLVGPAPHRLVGVAGGEPRVPARKSRRAKVAAAAVSTSPDALRSAATRADRRSSPPPAARSPWTTPR